MSRTRRFSQTNALHPASSDCLSHQDSGLPPSPIHSYGSGNQSTSLYEDVSGNRPDDHRGSETNRGIEYSPSVLPKPHDLPALRIVEPDMSTKVEGNPTAGDEAENKHALQSLPQDLLDLREHVNRRRIFLDNDRRRSTDELQSVIDALAGFVKEGDALTSSLVASTEVQERALLLQKSWKELRERAGRFRSDSLDYQQKEHELILLESRLLRKEKDVYQRSQGARSELSPTGAADRPREDAPSSPSGSQANEDHPLVKQYYSSHQEATRLRDDLINYEASHVRRKGIRDRKRAEGQLVPSDSMFIQKYLEGQRARVTSLIAVNKEMNRLWQQCVEKNLEVEPPRIPPIREDALLSQLNRIPQQILDYATFTSGNADSLDVPGALLVGDSDTESRITSWLDQVDLDPQPGEPVSTVEDSQRE